MENILLLEKRKLSVATEIFIPALQSRVEQCYWYKDTLTNMQEHWGVKVYPRFGS